MVKEINVTRYLALSERDSQWPEATIDAAMLYQKLVGLGRLK